MKKLIISNELIIKNGIPVLRLDEEDETGIRFGAAWLSPFRGYCFQVSGSEDGDGDYGSTSVIGLGHLLDMPTTGNRAEWQYRSNLDADNRIREVVKWGAATAIMQYCSQFDIVPCSIYPMDFHRTAGINRFVDATIAWLNGKPYYV